MAKPSPTFTFATNANFAVGNAADIGHPTKVVIPAGNIAEGFNPGFGLPAQWVNWALNLLGQWSVWLDAFESTAHTWSAAQTLDVTGDTNPDGVSAIVATNRKLWWRWTMTAGEYARLYYAGGTFEITLNAVWGGATWTQDTGADNSTRFTIGLGAFVFEMQTAGHAAWADGAWVNVSTFNVNTGTLSETGAITATTTIAATTTVTGGTGVTATTGNVTATAGDLVGRHLVGNTGTPTKTAGAGAGAAPTITVAGTDIGGTIQVLAGAGPVAGVIVSIAFANAMSAAPKAVVLTPILEASIALAANATAVAQSYATTGFDLANVGAGVLVNGVTYKWTYTVIG